MWQNPQETAEWAVLTEEILNKKLHFLCSANNTLKGVLKMRVVKISENPKK